jgi:hypothetical protein
MASEDAFSSLTMKHFIITPFYVRRHFTAKTGKIEELLAPPEWLDDRLRLFEDYCLPSIVGQSNKNFDWLIYFDQSTPAKYLDRVASLTSKYGNISIKLCAFWEATTLIEQVTSRLEARTKWVITTRLDNDDGLHGDFVSMLHSAARQQTEFLNFPRGIIWYAGKCYLYKHPSNAFLSMVEPAEGLRTVWSAGAHSQAARIAPVRQLQETPAFLQVVHGKNVSNKPRGTRIDARRALTGFESIPALQRSRVHETRAGIALENATSVMLWKVRDILIELTRPRHRRRK